jgi:MFS family permease
LTHGRAQEAEAVVRDIESKVGVKDEPADPISMRALHAVPWSQVVHVLLKGYRSRTVLGLTLMAAQAFFYNAIFFTYALVLARFYGVAEDKVGYYIFPFAIGNFLGPLVLGGLFDSIGRRTMIALTYSVAGIGLFFTGYFFSENRLTATELTLCWSAIFFVASAAASSAYLTVSEIFPLEMRAVAISLFYAAGTALGGFVGPPLFGAMIESGSRQALFGAYSLAAGLMCAAALVAAWLGIDAERRSLEEVAPPLGQAN